MVEANGREEPTPREAAVEQRDRIKHLTSSPEWGMVMAFIKDQCDKRVHHLMVTATTEGSRDEQNHMKGEYAGLKLVEAFVRDQLGAAEEVVALYREHARLEHGDAN